MKQELSLSSYLHSAIFVFIDNIIIIIVTQTKATMYLIPCVKDRFASKTMPNPVLLAGTRPSMFQPPKVPHSASSPASKNAVWSQGVISTCDTDHFYSVGASAQGVPSRRWQKCRPLSQLDRCSVNGSRNYFTWACVALSHCNGHR
jgi:hypothetical protein